MKNKTLPPEQRYRSRGGKFIPALCNILGTLMLLVVIATALPLTLPQFLGYEIYEVVSGSMAPTIPIGSVIYVETLEPEDVQAGDVITFVSGETLVTHRVVENRFIVGEFITKGDANAGEDLSGVRYDQLVGRVVRHFPFVGRLMTIYTGSVGKMYVLAFAACGVMFNILAGRMRDRQRDKLRQKVERDLKTTTPEELEKAVRRPRRTLRRVLMILLLAVFLFSAGTVAVVMKQYREGDAMYEGIADQFTASRDASADDNKPAGRGGEKYPGYADPAPIQVDFEELTTACGDVEGWIYCEDSVINYPVLHAGDNDYYLHRDFEGRYSVFGSIFAEAENRDNFADANTIIYGHHMRNGSMFASLENWADQKYYEEHPVMWLLTPEQDYQIVLFSGYTTSATSDTYQIFTEPGEDLTAYLEKALASSDFTADVTLKNDGRYVVLSTCAYVFDNARYVLHGMLIPAASAGGVPFE